MTRSQSRYLLHTRGALHRYDTLARAIYLWLQIAEKRRHSAAE